MRKVLFTLLVLTVLSACNDDDNGYQRETIYDIAPITLSITVMDTDGNFLLENGYNSPILQGLKLYYNDKCYTLEEPNEEATRAYLTHFYPLRVMDCKLVIGEWDGTATYDNEIALIEWGDGSTDSFTFSNKVTYNGYHPTITREMYFNEQKLTYPYLTIRK